MSIRIKCVIIVVLILGLLKILGLIKKIGRASCRERV